MISIYYGVCRIYTPHHSIHLCYPCISIHLPLLLDDVLGGRDPVCLEIHLKSGIERDWRCTWRPRDRVNSDILGCHDWARLEMDLEAEIEWSQWCTWRPRLSEFGDALGGRDRVNSVMHLADVIEGVGRYTWRLWWIKIGGVLGGGWYGGDLSECGRLRGDWSEAGQSGGSQSGGSESGDIESGGGRSEGMCNGSWDSIHWLTHHCENRVQQGPLRAERLAGSGRRLIVGWCSTLCMQYSVYAVLCVNSLSWHGEIERDDLTSCS